MGKIFPAVVIVIMALAWEAAARIDYMRMYDNDPFSKPEMRNSCLVCHLDPAGGGERNSFGRAFEQSGKVITAELRKRFEAWFMQDRAEIEDLEIIFESPDGEVLVLKKGNKVYQLKPRERDIRLVQVVAEQKEQKVELAPTSERFALPFDQVLVNLPSGQPMRRGEVGLRFAHRFSSPVFDQSNRPFDLFGLDTFAFTTLGANVGITNRLTLGFLRSTFNAVSGPVIEFTSEFAIAHEREGRIPLNIAARATIEGADNFKEFYTPNLQLVLSRSLTEHAQVYFVPTFSLNTNPADDINGLSNHTIAMGVGAAVRVRPRLSLVGEYFPRASGFRTEFFADKPTVSWGIQYRTYRHVFAFVFSNSFGTTTSRYAQGGRGDFVVGFNLYRQLH